MKNTDNCHVSIFNLELFPEMKTVWHQILQTVSVSESPQNDQKILLQVEWKFLKEAQGNQIFNSERQFRKMLKLKFDSAPQERIGVGIFRIASIHKSN